jgi:transposase
MRPADKYAAQNLIRVQSDPAILYASLELSQSSWLVTSLSPGSEKMSKYATSAGDGAALLALLARLQNRAMRISDGSLRIVVIQEAGLDGFWVHRLLEVNGVESHVVDPASIAVSRRRRRAKTDVIDGETLLRTLLAWKRGEPRVCEMLAPPTPDQEDRRRLSREREILLRERVQHVNRIKGLLVGQGISDYDPLHKDRRKRLAEMITGDGRSLPARLKAALLRELDRIELLLQQIADVEAERDASVEVEVDGRPSPIALLLQLKAIGPQIASVLYNEGLYRSFANRRDVAAYASLAPTPWRSGSIDREQGISKAGNPRLRHIMIELAWLWVRHQPDRLVPRARGSRTRACPSGHDSGAGPKASDRSLALCDPRRNPRGSCDESRLTRRATYKNQPSREGTPTLARTRRADRIMSWLKDAAIKIGSAL